MNLVQYFVLVGEALACSKGAEYYTLSVSMKNGGGAKLLDGNKIG